MRRVENLAAYLCPSDERMGAIMERFNTLAYPFVIVVDAEERPLGTITDGDIRRAILAGSTLETPASDIMNAHPLVAVLDDVAARLRILEEVPFVPLVDGDGRLREVWHVAPVGTRISTALVMAGGFGRRLGDMTRAQPKPLVTVGDKPILEHILGWLETGGVRNVYVSTHYLADRIRAYLAERRGDLRPKVIHEDVSLGTAGALTRLPDSVEGPILVINGDVLTRLDLEALDDFHHAHEHDCTIAVSPYEVSIPYGVIRQDEHGAFEGIDEKPAYTYFVASGIYVLAPAFCRLVPPGTRIDMPELINLGRKAGLKIGLFPIHEYWIDVGRPDDLEAAERAHGNNRRERPAKDEGSS